VPVALHQVMSNHQGKSGLDIVFCEGPGSQEWMMETPQEVEPWRQLARKVLADPGFFTRPEHELEEGWVDRVRLVLHEKPEED
jgi:hypothetical protein